MSINLIIYLVTFSVVLIVHFILRANSRRVDKSFIKRDRNPQSEALRELYTMPYNPDLTAQRIQAYVIEHYPMYFCNVHGMNIQISETPDGSEGKLCMLRISHMPESGLSAIEVIVPNGTQQEITGSDMNLTQGDTDLLAEARAVAKFMQQYFTDEYKKLQADTQEEG